MGKGANILVYIQGSVLCVGTIKGGVRVDRC